jgi:hypothetical protein
LGVELTTPRPKKNNLVTKCYKGPRTLTDSLDKRPKLKKIGMRFGTWNIRSMYRAGSVAKEISKFMSDLVGAQGIRWDNDDTKPAGEYTE